MHVILVQPEIAPNTGAIIRLCANTGCELHLVEPLGFELNDRLLRRGGVDYHEFATVRVHPTIEDAVAALPGRWFGFSSRVNRPYTEVNYADDDVLVFGSERSGLDDEARALISHERLLSIPMRPGNRSLNLANAASVVVYEAWRQRGFAGASDRGSPTAERIDLGPFDR